jgi:hypothetical protein
MRAGGGSTRDASGPYPSGPDAYGAELPPEGSGFRAWFRRASALTRWIILIVLVGLGTAALVAVGVAALVTLLESSV